MAEGRMRRRGSGARTSTNLFRGRKNPQLEEFSKKVKEINEARSAARSSGAAARKEKMKEIVAGLEQRKAAAKPKASRPSRRRSGQMPQESIKININTGKPTTRGTVKKQTKPDAVKQQTKPAPAKPKTTGVRGDLASQRDVRPKKNFNVGVSKGGVSFKEAFKHFKDKGQKEFTWNGKRYTTATKSPAKATTAAKSEPAATAAKPKMKPASRRTGSARRMSSRKFAGGGMASKMSAKGGARGGKKMMKDGGLAMTTINGRKVPAFAADGKGPNDLAKKKKNGGMMKSKGMAKGGAMTKKGMAKGGAMTKKGMAKGGAAMKKKGYAKGGMAKKGYAKGGMAKKGYSKGGAVRRGKPRGVGVALRGYGKALKK